MEELEEDGESVDDLLVAYNAAQGTLGWTAGPSPGAPGPGTAAAALLAERPPLQESAVLQSLLDGDGNLRLGALAADGGESSDWETSSDEGGDQPGQQEAGHDAEAIQDRCAAQPLDAPVAFRSPVPRWDPLTVSPFYLPAVTTTGQHPPRRPCRRPPRCASAAPPCPSPPSIHRSLAALNSRSRPFAFHPLEQPAAAPLPATVAEGSTVELAGSVMSVVDRLLVVQVRTFLRLEPRAPERQAHSDFRRPLVRHPEKTLCAFISGEWLFLDPLTHRRLTRRQGRS